MGFTDNLANTAWTSFGGPLVWGGAALFGSKKEAAAIAQTQQAVQNTNSKQTTTTSQITNNTTNQYDYSQLFNTINGNNNTIDSKKSMSAAATAIPTTSVTPTQTVTPTQSQKEEATTGTDFTMIAVIAAVGLVVYGFISKPSKQTHVSVNRKGANYAK